MRYVVVDRSDPRSIELREEPSPPLADGDVRFRVDSFAFTANSVTYMVAGEMLGYWDFYPVDPPLGRSPVMGHAEVVESAHPDIPTGGRWFGWFPIADEVVIRAEPTREGIRDVGEHRADHAAVYTRFEPADDPAGEDKHALLYGLFGTSFLADDFLAVNDDFGARQTIVLSASSKTGIALGWCLSGRGHHTVGATSSSNADFVRGLGCWDEVVTYDELSGLEGGTPTNLVDLSGRAEAVAAVHQTFGDALGHSMIIGSTAWESPPADRPVTGPAPSLFFAPSQLALRRREWGVDEFDRRVTGSWLEFAGWCDRWLTIVHHRGVDETLAAYRAVVDGAVPPDQGLILSLVE